MVESPFGQTDICTALYPFVFAAIVLKLNKLCVTVLQVSPFRSVLIYNQLSQLFV